jgi:hypothetical protein
VCGNSARTDLCGGAFEKASPTAINERRLHQELDYQTPPVARFNGLIAIEKNAIYILALMQIKDKPTI